MKSGILFSLVLLAAASLGPLTSLAEEADQDEVNPAEVRRFWLGAEPGPAPAAAPYLLTPAERASPELRRGTFGVDLSHYSLDLPPARSDRCKDQTTYSDDKSGCSCTVAWKAFSDNHIRFIYTKATDGVSRDLSFTRIWSELAPLHSSKTIFRGAYHFLRPQLDAEAQASAFLKAVGPIGGRKQDQLPPVLDIEWSNREVKPDTPEFQACPANRRVQGNNNKYYCDMWHKVQAADIASMAKKWIDIVGAATGRPVIIYTNPTGWWNHVMKESGDELMKRRAIWTSRYTSNGPRYDRRWTKQGGSQEWKMAPIPRGAAYPSGAYSIAHFWQFTESGRLPVNSLVCGGASTARSMDMNWLPVRDAQFRKVFGVDN